MSSNLGRLVWLGGIVVFACYGYKINSMLTNTCIDNHACQFDV